MLDSGERAGRTEEDSWKQPQVTSSKYNGPILWNSIPDEIKAIKSIPRFKKHLKAHYISKYVDNE